ncbi:putative steroid-binding protein 3 [Canna indica]|uniref:Steroid-binding protein 3 n=1 Tax=Canna indica TaxID=4628 RepID=A0AAQ3KKI7_9LILI|nr:putative steroid-binding protein 3 [Canna indica]
MWRSTAHGIEKTAASVSSIPRSLSQNLASSLLPAAMELTVQQLRGFDGSDASKPIYVAVRGAIYDVSSGKGFYGPGGPYAIFAGREASRALAKMSKEEEDVCGNLGGLSDKELGVLADWEKKFQAKYPIVGRLAS